MSDYNQNYYNENIQGDRNQNYYSENTQGANQQYSPRDYYGQEEEPPVSIGNWLGTMILMCIPCVSLILIIVWACGGSEYKSKVNWARASLLFSLIIAAVIGVIIVIISMTASHGGRYYY